MDKKCVKDLMVPLDKSAMVSQEATLLEAVLALDEAQKKMLPDKHRHRAVLVVDSKKQVVGKVGQHDFLKALEPKYGVIDDLEKLSSAGVSSQFISSTMKHFQFFQDNLSELCERASLQKVKEVMQPISESIDENHSLREAIHNIVILQTMSLLVTRKGTVIGVLRRSDLYEEIAKEMRHYVNKGDN